MGIGGKITRRPGIAEIGAHWKAMSEVMDFVPLASLPEGQHAFAHFSPL
jgi:hypothetical protein